ncbi:hypothetical protein [uncultured Jatrophihabitans sp.]|uniref:hypothetical protein n=1 Tax=uncultured Jatrophihabitans sp. TaxID=1610747 RepID=UPI0035CC5560
MGLKNWLHNKRLSDPVDGTYELTSCSSNSGGAAYENCRMHGVVTAPGINPVAVEHYCTAPTKRWPQPGQTLPVTVDRADPTRLHIEWEHLPTDRERGQQLAEELAGSMSTGGASGTVPLTKDTVRQESTTLPVGTLGAAQSLIDSIVKAAEAQGAHVTTDVTYSVVGAPGRAMPGAAGGGLTPEQAAAAGTASGMQRASARVLAVHEVAVPPGMPGGGAAGTVDLTLDVAPVTGEGWTTTMRIAFSTPQKRAAVATVGTTLPVFVDPSAHDRIAIDTASLT